MFQEKAELSIPSKISNLEPLWIDLRASKTINHKIFILTQFLKKHGLDLSLSKIPISITEFNEEEEYIIKAIFAINQGLILFKPLSLDIDDYKITLKKLLQQLKDVDHFYQYMGGIVGYQLKILQLIDLQNHCSETQNISMSYFHPEGIHLADESPETKDAVRWGIEHLDQLSEIFPVGGSGDRLGFFDADGTPLPAASLPFLGRTLLEGLIRDVQAKEYLFYKFFGRQIRTPIAMMTSEEKGIHERIFKLCEENHWFGRCSSDFLLFIQPLVPVVTEEGQWSMNSALTLNMKPGGHGVIWKLAAELGVFDWFEKHDRHQCLIRQINNPIAGMDQSLFALWGRGIKLEKSMGFLSCERLQNVAEGTNVLIEQKTANGYSYCLTNIEYTDFAQRGIDESPAEEGSCFSKYPTNTNILFINIESIKNAIKHHPIPGFIINMKTKVPYLDENGTLSHVNGGRLESTMQNIADELTTHSKQPLNHHALEEQLHSFIIYNTREKTISTTKKQYTAGESIEGTPEKSYYDLQSNYIDLLKNYCQFTTSEPKTIEKHLYEGPSHHILFHPALGPLYSIIRQKLRGGTLTHGSELQLEIAEIDISNLYVEGSLIVRTDSPLGITDDHHQLSYGQESRCRLKNVNVVNKGIDFSTPQCFWKNQLVRKESLIIQLGEGSEFFAENVTISGSHLFEVPPHHRMTITQKTSQSVEVHMTKIDTFTWSWQYRFNDNNEITLI